MRRIDTFKEVDVDECWQVAGQAPISLNLGDVNEGSEESPAPGCPLQVGGRGFQTERGTRIDQIYSWRCRLWK